MHLFIIFNVIYNIDGGLLPNAYAHGAHPGSEHARASTAYADVYGDGACPEVPAGHVNVDGVHHVCACAHAHVPIRRDDAGGDAAAL